MQLLVIRHAIAVERGEDDTDEEDAARPLTKRGRRRFARAAQGLERLGLDVERLLHSPWRRAVETAELLAPLVRGEARATRALTTSPRAELLAELSAPGDARVAVVGHEPWLGELVGLLTCGATTHGDALRLKKGGVAWLEGTPTPAGMRLRALLPPRLLRALA